MRKAHKNWWLFVIVIIVTGVFITLKTGWHFIKKDLAKQPQQKSVIKPLLQDELKRMIIAASDSLYHIEFSSFVLNIDSGKGLIKNIKLTGDSNVYQRLQAKHKAPNMLMNMKADSMVIDHFEFVKTSDGRQLEVNNILIQNPVVYVDYHAQQNNDTSHASSPSLLASAIKKMMQLSIIKHIKMNNVSLVTAYHSGTSIRKTTLRNIDIAMDGMDIKSSNKDSSNNSNSIITITGYQLTTADKLYTINLSNIRFNPDNGSAFIKKATVQPAYSKTEFFKHVSKANDRYYFIYNNMQITGLDLNRLLHQQQIKINKMTVGSSLTDIYTDYALRKRTPPVRNHGFPHELLQQLAFDITIDTMLMHKGELNYEIKTKKSDTTALFRMSNMKTEIINLTNNTVAKAKNHFTTITSSAKLMNAAQISSVYTFNLTDKNGAFSIKTELGEMDGTALNTLTKPLALLEIKSLDIQKMITTLNANESSAKGNIDFYYKHMKVALLKKKDEGYKKQNLLSFASNIIMSDDNPKKNGKFKKGPISITRNPRDSFFGYIWRCTFDGMAAHMMGINKVRIE